MAAGNFTFFNIAKKKLTDGTFDLDTHSFKVALTTSSQVLDATFAGTSTDARYADLTNELANGNGYTTTGQALGSVTLTRSTGTVAFDAADPTWTFSASKTFKYLVLYDDTDSNDGLVGFWDLDTGGGSITISSGGYTITFNASGIFTYA